MMLRLIKAILLFAVFLTPLLQAKHPFGYEQMKVLFFMSALILCVVLLFVYSLKSSNNVFLRLKFIDKKALLFIILLFVASIFGINPVASIFGIPSYYQGFILYLFLFIFYMLIKIIKISTKDYALTLSLSSLVVSFDASLEWIQLHVFHLAIPTYNERVVSTFGQPNLYSGFLLLTLPFSVFLFSISKKSLKIIMGIIIFINIGAIVISESRASIILLILLFAFYLFKLGKRFGVFLKLTIIFTLFSSVLFAFIILPRLIVREIIDPLNGQWVKKNAPEKRILIWQVAVKQILSDPLLGYGLESFRNVYKDYFNKSSETYDKAFQNRKNLVVDRAHNYILDLFVFSGVGAIIWISLILSLSGRAKSSLFFISLLLYVVWVQIQIQSVVHLIYFWALTALIEIQRNKTQKNNPSFDKSAFRKK